MWQTNRIDFAAGAKCHDGLEQRRGEPLLLTGKVLDSLSFFSDPSAEIVARAETNKKKAREEKREEAAMMRQEWVALRVDELTKETPNIAKEQANETVLRAVENQVLMGNWQVSVVWIDGIIKVFSVQHIIDSRP